MRIWEIDDKNAMPADMVREQDFVMRVRRMQRSGQAWLIVNIVFEVLDIVRADVTLKEDLQGRVASLIKQMGGESHAMLNGDMFTVLPLSASSRVESLVEKITVAAMPDQGASQEDCAGLIRVFQIPADYTALRERTNHYIDAARAASTIGAASQSAERALQGDAVRGPLTAWSLSQIERLLNEIDVRRYVRNQPIYQRLPQAWKPVFSEYFVSVEELKHERFPRLDVRKPERLFHELCGALDKKLLQKLTETSDTWANLAININLSVETILSSSFAQFCHVLSPERRRQVGFEVHRADLLMDFSATMHALHALRKEGFRTVLDGLHPDILPYLNTVKFPVDYYKVRVSKDQLQNVPNNEVIHALRALPAGKVVFYRCDNEIALELGQQIGVDKYQGWLIDDLAHTHTTSR